VIFKSLTIMNYEKQITYNYYKFNETGLNIILGQKGFENDETNGVGKTALVECIKYCLGASLPLCFKNKLELFKHNIFVILEVIFNKKTLRIGRFLYDDSFAYITDNQKIVYTLSLSEMYNKDDFKFFIEKLVYDFLNEDETIAPPSFASVREYLMREEKSGFQDIGLMRRTAVNVNQLLSFLSLIPYYFESNLNTVKNVIKDLKNELSIIKEIGKEIKEIQKKHEGTINEIAELKKNLETADVSSKISYDEKKYYILKENLSITQQKIHQLEYAKKQHEKNIKSLEENLKKVQDIIDLKDFYSQILDYFPERLIKNYDEMNNFYNFMIENRGAYFNKQIESLSARLQHLTNERLGYLKELSACTKFVKNSDLVVDLREISNQINDKYKEIAEYEFKIEKYKAKKSKEEEIKKQEKILEELTEKYEAVFRKYKKNIDNIIEHFYKLNEVAYGEKGTLNYNFENSVQGRATTGRIKITCNIPDEEAHGRFLMKINMFDIALLLNRLDQNSGLLFLFHDGSYSKPAPSIKGNMLVYIDNYLKEASKGQYFITINTEELKEKDLLILEKQGAIVAKLERTDNNVNRALGVKY